jgi:hypothetical protein
VPAVAAEPLLDAACDAALVVPPPPAAAAPALVDVEGADVDVVVVVDPLVAR